MFKREDGLRIKITFDEELIGDLITSISDSNWDVNSFQIKFYCPVYVTSGPSLLFTFIPSSIEFGAAIDTNLTEGAGNSSHLDFVEGGYLPDLDRFIPLLMQIEVEEEMPS